MDPQQRLWLEALWEAFEDAGVDPPSLRGSSTGVLVGVMYHDGYGIAASGRDGELARGLSWHRGVSQCGVRPRGIYVWFGGPGGDCRYCVLFVVGGVASGVWALRSGECSLALAGGVTILATPDLFVDFSVSVDWQWMVVASRSRTPPMAPAGARVWGCWCWSVCLMLSVMVVGCWRWCVGRL